MSHNAFQIDAALSRLLLSAQGDPITDLNNLPDGAFAATALEAGQRVMAAVADLGYRKQHDRAQANDHPDHDGHAPGTRYPIARIQGFQCAWIDPGLLGILAHDFGLNAHQHARLLGALLVQLYAYVLQNEFAGDFGSARASVESGELSIDIAPQS